MSDTRPPAVAGLFYPQEPAELRQLLAGLLEDQVHPGIAARAAIVPHAGVVYSGACAMQVLSRLAIPPVVVILAPNHTAVFPRTGAASVWASGAFETPLGRTSVDAAFASALLEQDVGFVADGSAHREEHAIEVELPLLKSLAPETSIVPIVVHTDEWETCRRLAAGLARVVRDWDTGVLLLASSDMTHFEPADAAARKDEIALEQVRRLDGAALLDVCARERITMCGRAPAATVMEAARLLDARGAELVDYRHSGWVTGDDTSVVAYAGVIIP